MCSSFKLLLFFVWGFLFFVVVGGGFFFFWCRVFGLVCCFFFPGWFRLSSSLNHTNRFFFLLILVGKCSGNLTHPAASEQASSISCHCNLYLTVSGKYYGHTWGTVNTYFDIQLYSREVLDILAPIKALCLCSGRCRPCRIPYFPWSQI